MKLCFGCKYFQWENASPGYSEMTPGDDFGISCLKGVWRFDAFQTTQDEFEGILKTAETCEHFELRDELKNRKVR